MGDFEVGFDPEKHGGGGFFEHRHEFPHQRGDAEESVGKDQAAVRQGLAGEDFTGKGQLALALPTEGGGEGLMEAEFDKHYAEQMGESGHATAFAATVFDGFSVDRLGVAQVETGAVEGHQTEATVESTGMADKVRERS